MTQVVFPDPNMAQAFNTIKTTGLGVALPYELHHDIIDEIHRGMAPKSDPQRMKILSQCSLVSSWWFLRARHWMFYDIRVEIGPQEFEFGKTYELVELLQASESTIARDLHYVYIAHGPMKDSPYDEINKLIVAVLPHLQGRIPVELDGIPWNKLDKPAQSCILRLQTASLCFSYSEDPIKFGSPRDMLTLSSTISPSLEALKIFKFHTNMDHEERYLSETTLPPLLSVAFPRLHTLWICLNLHVAFFESNFALFRIPTLRTITLEFDTRQPDLSFKLRCIEEMGSNLRHLTLLTNSFPHWHLGVYPLSLHRNDNLSSLVFDQRAGVGVCDAIGWIPRIIETASTPVLDVYLECMNKRSDSSSKDCSDFSSLERSLICSAGQFSKTRTLYLAPHDDGPLGHTWFDDREELLPELIRRGILRCGRAYPAYMEEPPWPQSKAMNIPIDDRDKLELEDRRWTHPRYWM